MAQAGSRSYTDPMKPPRPPGPQQRGRKPGSPGNAAGPGERRQGPPAAHGRPRAVEADPGKPASSFPGGRLYAASAPPHLQDARFQDARQQNPGHQGSGGGRAPNHGRPPQARAQHSGPPGTVWLYGLHPVTAALANPQRRLRRLLLTEEGEAALASRLPPPWSQVHERIDRARLDQLLGRDAVHQGLALLADPLAPPPLTAVLERAGPLLILDQITDPRNVGAILRSAAAFGVAGVIAQDRHAPEETGALAKAASGALETVPLIRAVNLARTLVALKAAGLWTVGLAADAPALRGADLAGRRIALVLGAEGSGLRRLTRETCDEIAGLAMPGTMESLNVSAAATVALYELTRA